LLTILVEIMLISTLVVMEEDHDKQT